MSARIGWSAEEAHEDAEQRAVIQEAVNRAARINTRCPWCGNQTVIIGASGLLVCSWLKCQHPEAIHDPQCLIDRAKADQLVRDRPYMQHKADCEEFYGPSHNPAHRVTCTCGLAALLTP